MSTSNAFGSPYNELSDELLRLEARLKDEDFSDYAPEGMDCERTELEMLWLKYRNAYDDITVETKEKTTLIGHFNMIHKAYIKSVNLIGKAKRHVCGPPETAKSTVRVPPCDTGIFRGDYSSWPTFRDMFTAIYVNNDKLSAVEKLFYLFQKTEGEAREINRNIALTAENFAIAWDNLRSQYENKRVLINSQLRLLFNLPTCKDDSPNEVKRLQRDINNCMSVLTLFEIDIVSWDPIFVFLCSTKLSETTLNLWEQSVKNKTEIPKWKELNDFLTDRFHALESVSDIIATNNQWPSSSHLIYKETRQTNVKVSQTKSHHTKVNVAQCKLCKDMHNMSECPKFISMDETNKASTLRKFKFCFNCLKVGHMYVNCTNPNGCTKCQKKHHTLLHRDFNKNQNGQNRIASVVQNSSLTVPSSSSHNNIQSTENRSHGTVQNHHTTVSKKVMLATAWVNIVHMDTIYKVRALIDPCSDESFISEKIQRLLKLSTVPVTAEVTGLGGELVSKPDKIATFFICPRFNMEYTIKVEALVVAQITGDIPSHTLGANLSDQLPTLNYADPDFFRKGQIDILLGGDLYPTILRGGVQHGILGSLVAQETIFGWIVTGPTSNMEFSRFSRAFHLTTNTIDQQLARFWELEEVSRKPMLSEEDKKCEEIYCSTTTRRSDGRYVVDLPFKSNIPSLGPNRHVALRQFLRNEKALLGKSELKKMYDEVIIEYLTLGHMEKISCLNSGSSYYLPHHAVFKPESTSTKLRVVFNASSQTTTGSSLNDILYVGPVLQADLVALVLKWRFFRLVFNADITKMYRQILVNPQHARFQRIVFREAEDNDISDYQLNTVTFGFNCAPYLALRTILKLAEDEEKRFPIGSRLLRSSLYVDDALVGAHNLSDALEARQQLTDILKTAGFELKKWTSNSSEILEGLSEEYLLNSNFLSLDDKCTAKTLGLRWNACEDYFYFVTENMQLKNSYTKREVLSIIARLFDPAGWLSPVIITAKIIMQLMWLDKIDWDDNIKAAALLKWRNFIANYNEIKRITIPRWIYFSPDCKIEYHGFCDSSELAYAATLYIKVQTANNVYTNLLVAKSKVAPVKKPSLPRLELCGAVLLSELAESILSQLETKEYSLFLWSDSTIVLAWLKKSPCTWKTFVANRIATILEKVGNTKWSHVPTNDNPADLATRGLIPTELKKNKLWWHGPTWLKENMESWPSAPVDYETTEESKGTQTFLARSDNEESILDRFSSFSNAVRVIAYMFRWYHKVHSIVKIPIIPDRLTAKELSFVRNRLFLLDQKIHFPNERSCLQRKQHLPSNSPLLTLNPFLDEKGIMRVNGRLSNSKSLLMSEKHPIILDYNGKVSRLYVDFVHKLVHHGGPRLTLNTIRLECWILKAKNLVKTQINRCKECVIYKKKFVGQLMAPLPVERTSFSRPFTHTGVDFAGPFDIKSFTGRYCRITKGYLCLFVCFCTKAMHLEAVSDLSTPAFMAALARFISRRGCPNKIFSDNGRNFVGAARTIDVNFEERVKELSDKAVNKYGHQKLSWHFIPAGAPHMGGLWEAGVKSAKMHFKKISGHIHYTFEEFSTLLCSIEACLNSRPLGPMSSEFEDLSALTPAHFLIGSSMLAPAEQQEHIPSDNILNRWRKVKAIQNELCRRWKEEYLKELHRRNKWKVPREDITEGDLVVIRNEPVCPTEWRLGRVIKVFRGSDGHVRVAELRTQNGIIKRPIHKMVLLPRSS